MQFTKRIYTSLLISFLLFGSSLYLSIKSINETSNMIEHIETVQLKFSHLASKLGYDVEANQAEVLNSVLLENNNTVEKIQNSIEEIDHRIKSLDAFAKDSNLNIGNINQIMFVIHNRMISYKLVENSLLEAFRAKNSEDIQDALIGLNAITIKFAEDIDKLIAIANNKLNENISLLKKSNDNIKHYIFYLFVIAFSMILFVVYKQIKLHAKAKKDLNRALLAEKEQKKLQSQLLKYNDDLESEVAKKTKELHEKIYTHFLTGLANRNKLLEDSYTYKFKQMALLNIDAFQKFNDVYGEELGNIALQMSSDFLTKQIDDDNTLLYHIGSDEFVIAVKDSSKLSDNSFIEQIKHILKLYKKEKFAYDDKAFNFMMSAGIAFSGRKKMLAYADMALKDAKKRNIQLSVFNEDKELEITHKQDIDCYNKLLLAFKENLILSYFQPIVPIQDSTLPIKYESLVRLQAENGTVLPPINFITIAKQNRIYHKITKHVVYNTIQTISKYQVPCSLNISMEDIENNKTTDMLYSIFDSFEYNHLLTIELLETEEFKDYKNVYDFCIKTRSYGIRIALDDFGAGYSNFSHILHLPIDYIKIDASLISNIDRDTNSQIMVETIVELAKKLHIQTIAEYVSSKAILDVVKRLHVDYAQGYYLGKPEKIEKHLPSLLH